jgi:crotonobetainyl-CoA:carnitine CoA-transferase CaiB-like acyl-CoA transferase
VTGPLAGLRVLDLSEHISGQYATRLMAGLGAEVTLGEPPGGSALRNVPPFSGPSGRSMLFWHLNLGKRSVDLPAAGTAEWRAAAAALGVETDVLVVGDGTSVLGDEAELAPHTIVCRVSDFGSFGPYSNWRGSEMIHQALSGTMLVTGDGDREPLYGCGNRAYYASGVAAFNAVLAALQVRDADGTAVGQDVEIVVAEVAASMAQNGSTVYFYNGTWAKRGKYRGLVARIPCSDRWVVIFGLRHWPDLCNAFGLPELAEDDRFRTPSLRMENWPAATALFTARARQLRAADVVAAGQAKKACVEMMNRLEDVLVWDHLAARDFLSHQEWGSEKLLVLGPPWRMSHGGPWRSTPTPPPEPRNEGEAAHPPARAAGAGAVAAATRQRRGTGLLARRPLDGTTILDFTSAWAGPMATRTLAYMGAKVIKVEGPTKLDSWRGAFRGGDVQRFPSLDPGDRPFDRNAWFNTQNHDKLSVGVNTRLAGAREILLKIAARCDVVIANFSPGTMAKMGLGYEHLIEVRPDIILVEMPALGNTGPAAHHVGMGPTMESAAGMTALIGYDDGVPVLTGTAYLDPIGGLHGAAAVLSAIEHRRRTGEGQYVEVPQVEAAMGWIGEYLIACDRDGESLPRAGNARAGELIHLAVPTAGDDEWLVVACTDEPEWQGLWQTIGRTDWGHDPLLQTTAGRCARREELIEGLREWAIHVNKHEAAAALQAHGVRAAPVNNGRDLAEDPHMWARGFFTLLDHADAGMHWYPGLPYRFSRTPGAIRQAAPRFGWDSADILAGYAELDRPQIADLFQRGVVSSDPVLD